MLHTHRSIKSTGGHGGRCTLSDARDILRSIYDGRGAEIIDAGLESQLLLFSYTRPLLLVLY